MHISHGILQCIYLFALINVVCSFGARKGIRIDRFEACGYSSNTSFIWDEVAYENLSNGAVTVTSRGEVLREVPKLLITLDVQRCSAKESLDTCQAFAKLSPLDTCRLIVMKKTAWTGIVEAFEPRVKCPIKKSIYTSKNSTLDPNYSFFFPLDNWYWKIAIKVMDKNEYMMVCLDFQSYTFRKEKK